MRRSSFVPLCALATVVLAAGCSRLPPPFSGGSGQITGIISDAETGAPLEGAQVIVQGRGLSALTNDSGRYLIANVPSGTHTVLIRQIGYQSHEHRGVQVSSGKPKRVDIVLAPADAVGVADIAITAEPGYRHVAPAPAARRRAAAEQTPLLPEPNPYPWQYGPPPTDREEYGHLVEQPFLAVAVNPLSTFSVDVDRASYANVRRMITQGRLPPPDAVRIEEFVNYFAYDYAEPTGQHPIAIHTEVGPAPWRPAHRLVRIGLQARRVASEGLPPANLVFLLDVSGSMRPTNKLPLVQAAFRLLADQLRPEDRVAIVVYAGAAGLVLPSTPGDRKAEIHAAIDRLRAGGSTAGGAGIELAYRVAQEHFVPGGNNRVVLATDGDFNVGISGEGELVRLIEEKRESGVFLTVVSVGEGNLQDRKMEQLADHGNGNYAYLDNLLEARRVFVEEFGGTLFTVAKDVKVQVEFNPARVRAYRLIGYENRRLLNEEFDDDTRDAGDMGSGHSVTALYEVIPVGAESDVTVWTPDSLRYRNVAVQLTDTGRSELLFVKFRYKDPDGEESRLLEHPVPDMGGPEQSETFRFQTAVVEFSLLLRQSEYRGDADVASLLARVRSAMDHDPGGYRAEFVRLVEAARSLGLGEDAQP